MNIENDDTSKILADIKSRIRIKDYYFVILKTSNSLTSGLYSIDGDYFDYENATVDLYNQISESLWSLKNGIWIIQSHSDEIKHTIRYNPELFSSDVMELVLFQEFSKVPKKLDNQNKLQESIKREKIKQSLVYACYIDDREEILNRVKTASKAALNQMLKYTGKPLGLCASHDFLEGFVAICEAGADLTKTSLVGTPLEIAFAHSADIVRYIYTQHRDLFETNVRKKGFSIGLTTTDPDLLQMILDTGCDIKGKSLDLPTLHNFADFNNLIGMQFALDNWFDINFKNKHNETALDRAKKRNHPQAVEFLLARGATNRQ